MPLIKQVHLACVMLTLTGFVIRGIWMMRDSPLLRRRWVGVLSASVDTVLLAAGVTMAIQYHFNPAEQSWLAVKLVLVVVYIVLGSIALKRGRTKSQRIAAWVAALGVFGYIVAVARAHSPLPVWG
ncbi:MAG: SirB2 family protein [Pseudomonadota bacterium]|jgi:uncharacterized membrane protein SirB2